MPYVKAPVSLSTIIIISVIIGALIMGGISFVIYKNLSKDDSESLIAENNDNTPNSGIIVNETNDEKENDSNPAITNPDEVEEQTNTIEEETISTPTSTAKNSSITSPASFGEWTLASKYVAGNYVDVPVKVTNITRGATAAKEVKDYCENSIFKYEDAEVGMEWAVIEYQVDLTEMEEKSEKSMDTYIRGAEGNSLKYNGNWYILTTMNFRSSDYAKGEIITCKFAAALPIGCTDYLILIGSSLHTQAYIQGR